MDLVTQDTFLWRVVFNTICMIRSCLYGQGLFHLTNLDVFLFCLVDIFLPLAGMYSYPEFGQHELLMRNKMFGILAFIMESNCI